VRVVPSSLTGVLVLEPTVFEDERGFFYESWNARTFSALTGVEVAFVQDNHSQSAKGVLRGLHYQVPPHPQGKLVRVGAGRVYDVAVDIRRSSPGFGTWFGVELSAANRLQLWVPEGFAHGFVALEDGTELLYKTTGYYSRDCDRSIRWDDPDIGITWPLDTEPLVSEKDRTAPHLQDADVFP
jgi:dTDP-4-dehydrorhamnose 3,5-epimerase